MMRRRLKWPIFLAIMLASSVMIAVAQFRKTAIINVKDWGAIGDGAHDDTPAYDAADTYAQSVGGVIYFPPGTYQLTNPQPLNTAGNLGAYPVVSISCAGPTLTSIQFLAQGLTIANLFRIAPYYGGTISNCEFDTTKAQAGAIALHLIDAVGWDISHNSFLANNLNPTTAIELENSTAWSERNQITSNEFYELAAGIKLLQDTADTNSSFGYNIIVGDHFQIPNGAAGILLTSPSNYTAHFALYNARIDARANFDSTTTSGSVLSCVNGGQVYNSPIFIGAEGASSGTVDVSVDTNSSVNGISMVLMYSGGTHPTSGLGISNQIVAGASYQLIETGSSAPTGACNTGSLYLNASGAAGTTIYACVSGAWSDVK